MSDGAVPAHPSSHHNCLAGLIVGAGNVGHGIDDAADARAERVSSAALVSGDRCDQIVDDVFFRTGFGRHQRDDLVAESDDGSTTVASPHHLLPRCRQPLLREPA